MIQTQTNSTQADTTNPINIKTKTEIEKNKKIDNHFFKSKKYRFWLIMIISTIVIFGSTGLILSSIRVYPETPNNKNQASNNSTPKNTDKLDIDLEGTISAVPTISPTNSNQSNNPNPTSFAVPSPISTQTPVYTPTPTPTQAPTSAPTATPRVPNPPIMNISYPTEMQSISMTKDQTLCMVDLPTGGNHQGLKRKHQLNENGWSSYADHFTLCLDSKEGLNRLQLQYKNNDNDNDESVIYTRQFNFHRISEISISISGQIYRDINCNGTRDSGENNINVVASGYFFEKPNNTVFDTFTADSSGNFSYSTKINQTDTLSLQPIITAPSGYKSNPNYTFPTITFSSSHTSSTIEVPKVPNEFVAACQ